MKTLFNRLLEETEGVTLIEYALIGALIAIAAVTMMAAVGEWVNNVFSAVAEAFPDD